MDPENYDHYWKVEDVRRHFDELEVECDPPCHPIIVSRDFKLGEDINNMVKQSFDGLKEGNPPSREGAGGTYLIPGPNENQTTSDEMEKTDNNINAAQKAKAIQAQKFVSVFMPCNEEPNEEYYIPIRKKSQNRPKHDEGFSISLQGLREGTNAGGGAPREVAAYLLDHPQDCRREGFTGKVMGFAGVPPTLMVGCINKNFNYTKKFDKIENKTIDTGEEYKYKIENYKVGSLQKLMENAWDCKEENKRGKSGKSGREYVNIEDIPVEEVHKISVLDIRFANVDRRAEDILFRKGENGKIELIPIHNGYCFPEEFTVHRFVWLNWPQAKEPYNQEFIDYINSLDEEKDIALLEQHKFLVSKRCANTFRISTMLLKGSVEIGCTPFVIGSFLCKPNYLSLMEENISKTVDKIVGQAMDSKFPGMDAEAFENEFLEIVSSIMDSELAKLIPNF